MPRNCLPVPNARLARRSFSIPVALAFLLAIVAPGSRAVAQTCTASPCSGGAISTNPTSDPSKENQSASSSIVVSLGGTVNSAAGSVAVELDGLNTNTGSGLTNDSLGEASFVLTGPGGTMVLLGSTGNGATLTGYQITVSDSAGSLAPGGSAFGSSPTTVKPASYWKANYSSEPSNLPGGTVYPTTDGSATLTSVFGGFSTDGTWTLYAILSDNDNSAVAISGWKLYLAYTATTNVNTTTTLSANNNHQSLENTITFTATVSAVGGVSGGTVTFTDVTNNTTLCSGVAVSGGTATCTVSANTLGEGFSTIKGTYSGTGYVSSNGTAIEMVEGTSASSNGGLRWCNAGAVTSTGGDSTGKVYPSIIKVSGLSNTVANVEVELNGVNTTSGGLEGAHLLVAPGGTKNLDFLDEGFSATALSDVNVDILDSASNYPNGTQTPTNNSMWSPTDNNQFGTAFSNSIPTANSLDSAVPGIPGTINYAYPLGSVNESFETNFNGATANGDWALYLFDNASVAETLSGGWCLDFTLNTGTPTTTKVSSSLNAAEPNGAYVGNIVTLTATVKDLSNNPVTGGTVTFTENGVAPAGTVSGNNVVTPNGSGQATFTTRALAEGDHTILASYSGDSTDNESQGTIVQRIDNVTAFSSSSGVISACNAGPITSTDGATGAFTPNPSNLFVQSLPGTVQSVTLSLNNMYADSDETINNTEAMVAGPNNMGLDFYSGTGDAAFGGFGPFNMTFSDSALSQVPQSSYGAASYKPTDYDSSDTFFPSASGFYPLPGTIDSAAPHGSASFGTVFTDEMNGNGTWSLFWDVTDKALVEGTQKGWCINFTENPVTITPTLGYSGTGISSDFVQGEQGASITLDVTNNGTGSTGDPAGTNPLTVTDTLNSAFTYDSSVANGTDWTCSASSQTVTCTNHDTIAQDSSYPQLTIGVNVTASAAASVANSIGVSGAGITTNSADDSITVDPAPVLAVAKSHTDTFTQGQTATWNITVSNTAASGQTSGTITVNDTLPTGYTLQASTSTGNNFGCGATTNVVTCTSTAAIVGGGNNVINLTVNIPANSPTSVTNTASAYGGGDLVHSSGSPALSNTDPVTVVQVPASVTITAGGTQSASINTAFATQLTVLVKDAGEVAIPSQAVTLTAPASGASGTFSSGTNTITATTASTGTVGQLVETFTANGNPGGPYTVTATAGTVSANPAFSLSNTATTTTSASNAAATFSSSSQPVTLNATVTSAGGTVNAGTVTFSVFNGGTQIGSSTTPVNVTGGSASASYTLPGGTSAGTYTIVASYTGAGGFTSGSDNAHTLVVSAASTTTSTSNQTATFGASSVPLSATVTSSAGTVNEGTVTFTVLNGVTPVGNATTSGTVTGGSAGVNYTLPAGTPIGTYTIQAAFNGSTDFVASSDSVHSLSITSGTTTTGANATAPFSAANQPVLLSAMVTSAAGTVNAGTLTFSVFNSSNVQIGASTTPAAVTNGSASANYTLPGGTGTGTYTIVASYTGAGGFISSSDNIHTLMVQQMAAQVVVSGYPTPVTVGVGYQGTVTVEDSNGIPVAGYSGTATISTSDNSATVTTPITITNGTGTFTVTFNATGTQSITAAINGLTSVSQTGIQVNPVPGFVVTTATDDATGNAANCPAGGGGNDCSLRDALAAAASAGAANITFDSTVFGSAQTITLTNGTLAVPANTSVTGPGANLLTVSGNNAVTVLSVGSGVTASISGMNIANGLDNASILGGGGIYNAGTLSLSSCDLTSNQETGVGGLGQGGAIYNNTGASLTINQCTISNNVASGTVGSRGGALLNNGTAKITNSTFSANTSVGHTAGGQGGAIFNNSSLTLIDSTLSENQVTDPGSAGTAHGGAIDNAGTLIVENSTISGNSQINSYNGDSGGGIFNTSSCTLSNTILAGNHDTGGDPDGSGAFTDGGHNLIGNGSGISGITNGTNGNQVGTTGTPISADLAALANYGGPTQIMIPTPGSQAICLGSYSAAQTAGITADQRGVTFGDTGAGGYCTAGNIDIGAVQTDYALAFNPVSGTVGPPPTGTLPATAMTPSPQVTLTESGTAFTATAATIDVTDANTDLTTTPATASASSGVATFDSLIFTGATTGDTLTATLPLNSTLNITAQSASFDVGKIGTTTAISCASCTPNPTVGASLTFTAVVSPNSGSVTPTGSITFSVDSAAGVTGTVATCPGDAPANSLCATYTTTTLTATSHTVEALFTATGSFQDSNNSTPVTLEPAPALAIAKSHTGSFTQGSTGEWDLVVSNTAAGGSTSGIITVTDSLPPGLSLSSYTSTGSAWSCIGTTTITCTATPNLAGGASSTIKLTVSIPATISGTLSNIAAVWGGGDPAHGNSGTELQSNSDSVTVVQVPASIAVVSGSNQSATINSSFATPLTVVVKDAGGNTISGASVTFFAPGSGASGTFSNSTASITAATNGSGQLSQVFTANGTAGGPYSVTASSGTATTSPAFSLSNTAGTTTTATNQSTTFSLSSQLVTLSATVTSAGGTVNTGTVSFTVFQGATQIGSATTPANVSNGMASASYTLPGGTGAGSYTIVASYTGAGPFTSSSDNTHKLTVNGGTTTTAGANATAVYNASNQPVTLTAKVTSAGGTVNTGNVSFTVFQGVTQIGSATTPANVSNGSASAIYTLPGGTNAGNYTIVASYTGAGGFTSSSNNTHMLTVSAAGSATTAANKVASFSPGSQIVVLSATVTSTAGTVNGGTITFSVLNGSTPVGTAVTSAAVSGGIASVNYTLPAGTPAKSYTIKAVYNGSTNFTTSSDIKHTLTVGAVPIASISPTSINFGDVYLGKTVTKTVTIKNTGDAAMTISGPRIAIVSGGNSKEFVTVNLCPSSLGVGKSCVMTVTFIAGPFYNPQTATLMITDNAAGSPQSVSLTATVIHPVAQLIPESLRFPAEKTRSGKSTESITVASVGATPLEISRVAIAGADSQDFSETNDCQAETLNPKAGCSIAVTFKPEARGSETAILFVTDNAQTGPQPIPISGTGY